MSKREILAGATDQTIDVFVLDSSSTTGQGLAGLVYNTASLACYYRKGATGSATALTLATQTVGGAHSDGGFVEIQATNMKGVYRLDLSDTIVAAAGMVTVYLYGAANMAPVVLEIEVVAVDKFNATSLGLGNLDAAITTRLAPTTAGRTLDVSATGEAGIDWANVGSPTTTLALTNTTIATTQKVDLETIKTNPVVNAGTVTFPTTATLASTTNITAGTITTTTNLTNLPTIPTNWITADGIAADAIGASELATGAVNKIVDQVWDELLSAHTTIGTMGYYLSEIHATGDLSYLIVSDATNGNAAIKTYLTTNVGALGANLTAADDAVITLIGVAGAGLTALGDTRLANLDATVSSRSTLTQTQVSGGAYALNSASFAFNAAVNNAIADQVWDEVLSGHLTAGSTGNALNAAGSAGDPWSTSLPGAYGAGSAGYIIGTNLNATVGDIPTNAELATALGTADDATLAAIAALNNLSAAQVNTEVDTALSDVGVTLARMGALTDWIDGGRLDLILDARASQTSVDDVPTNAELATALGTADDATLAAIAALNDVSTTDVTTSVTTALTTALTEGYRGTGATGSVRDLLYEVIAHMGESSIVTTTKTLKKLDGSTTAKTYTLNDGTNPTAITETT